MSDTARVGAVHALTASIEPTQAAFKRAWPQADVAHLIDSSLYLDRSQGTADVEEIARRIDQLIQHSASTGAQGILFTGSFFGDAVRQARPHVNVAVLTSFDGIIERALGLNSPLRVISTAPDSTALLVKELEQEAQSRGLTVSIAGQVIDGAMEALTSGALEQHDALVLDAIRAMGEDEVIVIAQFSMERVIDDAPSVTKAPVIGTATEGVAALRRALEN